MGIKVEKALQERGDRDRESSVCGRDLLFCACHLRFFGLSADETRREGGTEMPAFGAPTPPPDAPPSTLPFDALLTIGSTLGSFAEVLRPLELLPPASGDAERMWVERSEEGGGGAGGGGDDAAVA